jgi:phage shock protein C
MSRERDQRDAERAARRARRLAERAEQRAQRKAEQAQRATDRAEKLAERARSSRRRSDSDKSFEDYVDEVAEHWEKKAEEWIDKQTQKLRDGDIDDGMGMDGPTDDMSMGDAGLDDDGDGTRRSAEREAEAAREDARRYRREAEKAEARARESRSSSSRSRRSRRSRRRARRSARGSLRSRLRADRGFYRDKERRKICGVCAGVADYLDVDTWQVRLVAVLGLMFIPSVALPVYFITYFLMDDKPYYRRVTDQYDDSYEDEIEVHVNVKKGKVKKRETREEQEFDNAAKFREAKGRFADLEGRLREMESHVTSSRFELQRELRKISGEDA